MRAPSGANVWFSSSGVLHVGEPEPKGEVYEVDSTSEEEEEADSVEVTGVGLLDSFQVMNAASNTTTTNVITLPLPVSPTGTEMGLMTPRPFIPSTIISSSSVDTSSSNSKYQLLEKLRDSSMLGVSSPLWEWQDEDDKGEQEGKGYFDLPRIRKHA